MKHHLVKYLYLGNRKRNSFFSLVLLLMMASAGNILAQDASDLDQHHVDVHAEIDTQQIKIGEQFHLTLQAISDSTVSGIDWATVPDTFNHLIVVKHTPLDTIRNKGQIIFQKEYTLTGFDSGRWFIPSFNFKAIIQKDSVQSISLHTDSLPIIVHTVSVDTTKPFNPIKEIRAVPFNLLDYWPYILGGFILLLIVLYFVFFYKKKDKHKHKKEKVIPQEPPYDQAIKNLKALQEDKLWQKDEVKAYYSRLTDILRLYIQRQYNINALEQTSDELLQKLKPITRLNQQRKNLETLLQTADLAKFAKLLPTPDEHEDCMKKAYEFVEWTKPQPENEEDKNNTN